MSRHHHHHRHHGNYQASNSLTLILLGAFIGSPLIFWFVFFQLATAPTMAIAAITATGSALFSFGIGALILYASIGVAYLCSAGHECYKTEKGPLDILKSRMINQDELSVTGVLNSIGAALWSPFIILGGLSGIAIKASVRIFTSPISEQSNTTNKSSCSKNSDGSSYSTLMSCLGVTDNPQPNKTHQRSSSAPIYTSLYPDIKPGSAERKQEPPVVNKIPHQ